MSKKLNQEDKYKLKQGFPHCPKCGAVMDSDVELDENHNIVKQYFFCWNDDTMLPDNRK